MKRTLLLAASLACVLLAVPRAADATPEFAKQWAANCNSCHVGVPTALDEEGLAFKLAGYSQAIDVKHRRPKYFFSFLTDLFTVTSNSTSDDMIGPEAAELFGLYRLDNKDRFKIFAIGELAEANDDSGAYALTLAHAHLQVNPLEVPERFSLRVGNVEPLTRLWNTDMRRVFETNLWGGVSLTSGEPTSGGGAHHGGGGGGPSVLPSSDWGGDVSSVITRDLMVAGGYIKDTAYAGVFWKHGGRGFDNTTVSRSFRYDQLDEEERTLFNKQQTNMARKWERSVILGLSAYNGFGSQQVFNGSFLMPEMEEDFGEEEHGIEEHGMEMAGGNNAMDEEEGEMGEHSFMPTRLTGGSRIVGEIITRWDRFGFYVTGVWGQDDYIMGDGEHWEEHGEFERTGGDSRDFFAWAVEAMASFKVTKRMNGRMALRYEQLDPEATHAVRYERAVANLAIPVRMMRPALWPYIEVAENLVTTDTTAIFGFRMAF